MNGRHPHEPKQSRRPARLEDVAQAAGVHVSTASRVLNDRPGLVVSEATRERIRQAATTLHYRPNAIARGLKLAETGSLGLLVPSLRNPVFEEVIRAAFERAWERSFVVLLAEDSGQIATQRAYERLVQEGRIEGLLIASARLNDPIGARLCEDGVPCVFVNRRYPGSGRNVSMREEDAGSIAAAHLLELGHRAIAHIAGPRDLDTAIRRTSGFLAALAEEGITPNVVHAAFDERAGFDAMLELLGRSKPSALFVSNINQAIGALAATHRMNARVPDDLALIACDDDPILNYLAVPLTSIRMPLADLGRVAVDALLEQIDGKSPRDILVDTPPQIIVRDSTDNRHDVPIVSALRR